MPRKGTLDEIDDIFYRGEILAKISERLGKECEDVGEVIHDTYWSAGFTIRYVYLKIRCTGEDEDIILYAPMARLEDNYVEVYNVDEAVEKALKALAK